MNKMKESYILPPFMVDPQYRVWRHLLFILMGAIITFNMIFIAYQDCQNILGNRIYIICLPSFILFTAAMYFNYYFLVPRFLLKERYIAYLLILSAIIYVLPILAILQEYWIRTLLVLPHRIASYTNPIILIDNLASFMSIIICFWGGLVMVLLRQWINKSEHVNWMEHEHLKSEVNKLKGQITPSFLSKTLNNTSILVKTNPQKTTNMLMKLGQLLRYQLYDCNRDRVLLKSEINFLTSFLDLEQLNRSIFQYSIKTENDLNNIFVSPMLFISLIQNKIEHSDSLHLSFKIEADMLFFRCTASNGSKIPDDILYMTKKRLELLYPNKHSLMLKTEVIELRISISE